MANLLTPHTKPLPQHKITKYGSEQGQQRNGIMAKAEIVERRSQGEGGGGERNEGCGLQRAAFEILNAVQSIASSSVPPETGEDVAVLVASFPSRTIQLSPHILHMTARKGEKKYVREAKRSRQ